MNPIEHRKGGKVHSGDQKRKVKKRASSSVVKKKQIYRRIPNNWTFFSRWYFEQEIYLRRGVKRIGNAFLVLPDFSPWKSLLICFQVVFVRGITTFVSRAMRRLRSLFWHFLKQTIALGKQREWAPNCRYINDRWSYGLVFRFQLKIRLGFDTHLDVTKNDDIEYF